MTDFDGRAGSPHSGGVRLQGRRGECEALNALLQEARSGQSAVLVIRGEPGVGKTALLEHMAGSASDLRVVRAVGVESEMELPFAALHQLCVPLLEGLGRIPAPQRAALETAFGQRLGPVPDRFLIGLAVLSLLSETAGKRPLVCVVDDAQWLDQASAQALAFAARRLQADPVVMVFAAREPGADFGGLPQLLIDGLQDDDARRLLDSVVRWPLDEQVRQRIVAEARGNPLALVELPRGHAPNRLAGGFGLPQVLALPGRIEESFRQRIADLPGQTRLLLQLVAADPVGDPVLVWRAATQLGIPMQAAEPAAEAGLLVFGARVSFRHPLVRSAAYRSASPQVRQAVHGALAESTDAGLDPDRRAWHRAQAAPGPDEDVAVELELCTDRAQSRGGLAAAAAFLERATALTPDPVLRARRALAAASAKVLAGAYDAAQQLLDLAQAGPLDERRLADADLLRAQLAYAANRGSDAPLLLLRAAKKLEGSDVGLARATYLHALNAALFAGRLAVPGGGPFDVARVARVAPQPAHPPRAPDLLLDGLAAHYTEGFAAGLPILRQALAAFADGISEKQALLMPAWNAALHIWDVEAWDVLSAWHLAWARDTGALSELPLGLNSRAVLLLFHGELAAAAELVDEAQVATEVAGGSLTPYGALALIALRGPELEARTFIDATRREAARRGDGIGVATAAWAEALLYNGVGSYHKALAAAESGSENQNDLGVTAWSTVELIEAAARSGAPERAADALRRLSETTSASGTAWALGLEARSRALLSSGDQAERLYREAIEQLGRTPMRMELARAHLLFGEWLRRENRRVDAREQLNRAYEMLAAMGAEGFAERARRELLSTGATVRKRSVDAAGNELTAQEAQIARLARDGLTNPEISTHLFISARTVEWHLSRVFAKLGITSRRQLRAVLAGIGPAAPFE